MTADYERGDLADALSAVGVVAGDVVFTHSSIGMLGRPPGGRDARAVAEDVLGAFFDVLGDAGTWVLPTYTYSYTRGEPYDPAGTPPRNMGLLADELWRREGAFRSLDPIFPVIAIGARAQELASGARADDCFGDGSIYALLIAADAKICNLGIGSHSALLHHVEQDLGVGYRYPKVFHGTTIVDGRERETDVTFNVRDLDQPRHAAYFMRLDADARADGSLRTAGVGRGEVNCIGARRMAELARDGLARDPEYLVLGDLEHGRPG